MTQQHLQHYECTANFATFKGCATICRLRNTATTLKPLQHLVRLIINLHVISGVESLLQ